VGGSAVDSDSLKDEVTGIICAMMTPRNKDGSVMKKGVKSLVDHLVGKGVDVLFPTGTAGEGPLLSAERKKEVISAVVDAAGGRIPVTPGIACPTTEETIAMGKFCEDLGVEAVVVVTPWYYRISEGSLYKHYSAIAEALESPVIAYKIPQAAVNDISLELLAKLADVDGIAAIKDSSGDMVWLSKAIALYADRFKFFGGNDRLILPCLAVGADGHVSGSSNCFTSEVVDIYRQFKKGDMKAAKAAQQRLLKELMCLPPAKEISAIREVLRWKGIETGEALEPVGVLTDEERKALKGCLAKLPA